MRILLIASGYNSMTQRVHVELADRGHEVSVELALGDEVMRDGVRRFDPDRGDTVVAILAVGVARADSTAATRADARQLRKARVSSSPKAAPTRAP